MLSNPPTKVIYLLQGPSLSAKLTILPLLSNGNSIFAGINDHD